MKRERWNVSNYNDCCLLAEPPFFKKTPPSEVVVVSGGCFSLPCEAYSTEAVSTTLQWKTELGRDIDQDDRIMVFSDGTLLVTDAEMGVDSGTYSCVATNEYGTSTAYGLVTVLRESHKTFELAHRHLCSYGLHIFKSKIKLMWSYCQAHARDLLHPGQGSGKQIVMVKLCSNCSTWKWRYLDQH